MNGIHDMGGLHGFGVVAVEKDEPVFHARWEGRVFALTQVLDTKGIYNLDEHRHEIELMDSASYLTDTYYGRWLFAMERILNRKNILRREEVETRIRQWAQDACEFSEASANRNWPLPPDQQIKWGAWRHNIQVTPLFKVGDRVRVCNLHPEGHTRLMAYVRGKSGIVNLVNANAWIFPDTRAHNAGENPQPVYNVAFPAAELWGSAAEPNMQVNADLSESYLELVM
jgi:nitrile hydratase